MAGQLSLPIWLVFSDPKWVLFTRCSSANAGVTLMPVFMDPWND